MRPIVNGLEEDYGDQIAFQRLNVAQEGQDLFRRYNLRGHPAYVIVNTEGEVLWRFVGQVPRQTLEEGIRQALASSSSQ